MDFVGREPFDVVNVESEFDLSLDAGFDLFVQNVAFVLRKLFGEDADDAVMLLAFEGEEDDERLLRETNVQRVVAEIPINLRVGDVKHALEGAARKLKPERVSDGTFRAVAGREVFSFDSLRRAVGKFNLRRNVRSRLR